MRTLTYSPSLMLYMFKGTLSKTVYTYNFGSLCSEPCHCCIAKEELVLDEIILKRNVNVINCFLLGLESNHTFNSV